MQCSAARRCLAALQLFALERRRVTMSYKHFESAVDIEAAFRRLPAEEVESMERSAEALRHDAALTPIVEDTDVDGAMATTLPKENEWMVRQSAGTDEDAL
ncbi:hypothetical protein DQ04_04741050 [Trypanosoma grayi]|uniref:hypothetical protein n=1 Tax=Trypanosoma grayi TaxID=71804 RepID=UPI0004F4A60B|nr:hypothetical protein DQ04_04741050 [Trypanosoma grayi]KEG09734.1 hypothetical protein DQ04_04741050 [Trypanosoma grayi]